MFKKAIDLVTLAFFTPRGMKMIIRDHRPKLWPIMRRLAKYYRIIVLKNNRVVAVTGSLGKSSTVNALQGVFVGPHKKRPFGNARTSLAKNVITCPPWEHYAIFEVAVGGPNRMRSHAHMVRPHIAVVTSIKSDHNRSFKTLDNTRDEKAKLVEELPDNGIAVLNGDDERVRWMAGKTKAKSIFYGTTPENDVWVSNVSIEWPKQTKITFNVEGKSYEACIPAFGVNILYSSLATVAVAYAEGKDMEETMLKLREVKWPWGRMQVTDLGDDRYVIDDTYKSEMDSITSGFDYLEKIPAKRKIVVFGDVEEPPGKVGEIYRDIGDRMAKIFQKVILIGGDDLRRIRAGIVKSGLPRENVIQKGRRVKDAVEEIKKDFQPGDVVYIKGQSRARLQRVALLLKEEEVNCDVKYCKVNVVSCDICPFLKDNTRLLNNQYLSKLITP